MSFRPDERANEAALYLDGAATSDEVSQRVRAALDSGEGLEIVTTRELKSISLAIFDRSGIKYTYKESAGGHTWPNWRAYLTQFAPQLFR